MSLHKIAPYLMVGGFFLEKSTDGGNPRPTVRGVKPLRWPDTLSVYNDLA